MIPSFLCGLLTKCWECNITFNLQIIVLNAVSSSTQPILYETIIPSRGIALINTFRGSDICPGKRQNSFLFVLHAGDWLAKLTCIGLQGMDISGRILHVMLFPLQNVP